MTKMLASVNCLEEAMLVLQAGVDIIDLKQPEQGALGALACEQVSAIVRQIKGRCPISATIGDLPMDPERVFKAVSEMAETNVDYIKIGLFPGGDWNGTLSLLAEITHKGHRLIAVLFADTHPNIEIIPTLVEHGFTGVMVDTLDKNQGNLLASMNKNDLSKFVNKARSQHLLCGLAGSLKHADIAELSPLRPDYLGFRGALCKHHHRTSAVDRDAVIRIRQALSL